MRPGSSTNATLRDIRSRTDGRGKMRQQRRSQDNKSDIEIEINSLDRDTNNDLANEFDDDDEESFRYGAKANGVGSKKYGKFAGKHNGYGNESKRREAIEDLDRSRLMLGTEEDNS